jgi:hypothetical protein
MKTLNVLVFVVLLLTIGFGVYLFRYAAVSTDTEETTTDTPTQVIVGSVNDPTVTTDTSVPTTKLEPTAQASTTTFSGILEEVNTGCFADGECFVSVSGVHVTTLVGRRQEVVGGVVGVLGFGDLENFVGEEVEVYAKKLTDGTYTLYGSEDFYIKLSNSAGAMVQMGETVEVLGVKITPQTLLEDSRCPSDVVCIQAGTVRVNTEVVCDSGTLEQVFVLNETVETEVGKITLLRVEPNPESTASIESGQYVFYFEVRAR